MRRRNIEVQGIVLLLELFRRCPEFKGKARSCGAPRTIQVTLSAGATINLPV
jgi:hypothetical protein